jgi:hypothetical protein
MSQRHLRLTEALDRISVVLGANPAQRNEFETWAVAQLKTLVRAENESRQELRWQAMEFKQEYLELQKELSTGISVTGRTELLRAARKEWLAAVLELVDELLEGRAAA